MYKFALEVPAGMNWMASRYHLALWESGVKKTLAPVWGLWGVLIGMVPPLPKSNSSREGYPSRTPKAIEIL
jgi:hypothetical protein